MGLKCPSVRTSVRKSFSDSDEIWYVGRVMHDGMPYDPIQDQGHETFKVRNSSIFKTKWLCPRKFLWTEPTKFGYVPEK